MEDTCHECSSPEKIKLEISSPLVDEEGIEHEGTLIRPVGEFFVTTAKSISKMSDAELERFYNRYSLLVKQCEETTERNRIVQGMLYMERQERQRHRRPAIKIPSIQASPQLRALAEVMKKAGITKEKLEEMLKAKEGQQ